MLNNSTSVSKKFLVLGLSAVMAVSVTSCSKSKSSADASPSASASVSDSASASASASPSASKSHKPKPKPTPTPSVSVKHAEPAPVKPLATKAYTQTVAPRPTISLDSKEQVFEKSFTAATGLSPKLWDAKVDGDPLTYKLYYKEMLSYAKGALCSYIATGLDDFTLGTYIANEVTYETDIQTALLVATRKAYGCKAS